ncbi:hypothetical protein ACJMK2_040710 [Sinanodonta woodiana]|uniref:Major facilitator superfamily (MFS) profile domain-containing protein n=1 Tax=Sinanodonta woodiana TaxID=1069815 RepID=A0ABD3W1W5_SINWO
MLTKPHGTILLCSIANFINSADQVIMPIAVVAMTDEFKWGLHGQGWVLSSFAIGYMSSQVIGGSAAKKYGGKKILLLSVLLWSMSTFIVPFFAHSIFALTLSRMVLGFGEGLGKKICAHLSWRWAFYSFGSLGFVWAFIWIYFYKENRSSNDEEFVEPPKVNNINVHWSEFICHWPLWSIYTAHFCMNWSNYIIMQWLPTYLLRTLNGNKSDIMLTAAPYVLNSVVGVVAGHFADSLIVKHKWTVLSVRRLMTSVGLMGPGLFILFFSAVNNLPLAVLFVTICLGLSACNSSGHLSNHAEVAPSHAGITFAISNTLATIPGIICGPLTAELVTQSHGRWFPVFIIAAGVNFVGAIIYLSQSAASQVL